MVVIVMGTKLVNKQGKTRSYIRLCENFYIDEKYTHEKFFTEQYFTTGIYFNYNGAAILAGNMSKDQLMNNKEYYAGAIETPIGNYILNLSKLLEGYDDKLPTHELYGCDIKYLQLINPFVTEYSFEKFKQDHVEWIEKRNQENERKYQEKLEKEKQDHIINMNIVGEKIKNGEKITGREMLDYIAFKNVDVPLRTKGLINRCTNITPSTLTIAKGNKPKSADSVFMWLSKLKEI